MSDAPKPVDKKTTPQPISQPQENKTPTNLKTLANKVSKVASETDMPNLPSLKKDTENQPSLKNRDLTIRTGQETIIPPPKS